MRHRPGSIPAPGLGQVELAVNQGPPFGGGVGGEHPDLEGLCAPWELCRNNCHSQGRQARSQLRRTECCSRTALRRPGILALDAAGGGVCVRLRPRTRQRRGDWFGCPPLALRLPRTPSSPAALCSAGLGYQGIGANSAPWSAGPGHRGVPGVDWPSGGVSWWGRARGMAGSWVEEQGVGGAYSLVHAAYHSTAPGRRHCVLS